MKKDIFEFNHIVKNLTESDIKTIRLLQTLSQKSLVFQEILQTIQTS